MDVMLNLMQNNHNERTLYNLQQTKYITKTNITQV